ncbi:MAG: polymer-forming cytoskeletal protein [Phenylobacterium sp.]|uniref:bactofilin family protein n=1 Tax=Phenylobacterium sp. TaxID=1871053 RepID=UPI0027220A0F|nr:polymer-forming cytoskeletal protein [Phenylobacterium sp.]MDO8901902.1 polymer-forming cytoskeletal protein [Phenylobacterium sp.]MDP2212404.1 polymer-forming cytoskeletal protein [Phenylobacterium sp.]
MFEKANKTSPRPLLEDNPPSRNAAAPSPAPAKPKAPSLIGPGLCVQGNVAGEAEVQIDGLVRGDVRVGKLSLGPQGRIEGSVVAVVAEIRGHIKGPMKARQVRLYGTAHVEGDIAHEQLAMETGAIFEGRSVRLAKPAEADAPAAVPAPPAVSSAA